MTTHNRRANTRAEVIYLGLSVIAVVGFASWRFAKAYSYSPATPPLLVAGLAATPYQYRVLVPGLVHGLQNLFPDLFGEMMVLFFITDLTATFLLHLVFRRYLNLFFTHSQSRLLSFSLFYALPFSFVHVFWYPWDLPSILFFTLGLWLIHQRNWRWYYPLFVIATFNRETTFFLTLIYAITAWGQDKPGTIARHMTAQGILWGTIKIALFFLYVHNPGTGFAELQFAPNLNRLTHWPSIGIILTSWGGLWAPVVVGWRRLQSQFLRRATLMAPPFCLIMLVIGVVDERRILGEMAPVIVPASLAILTDLHGALSGLVIPGIFNRR